MKISKTHQKFEYLLRYSDHHVRRRQTTLEYPELFLGPNWKNVLNFWIYLDTLSDEKLNLSDEKLNLIDRLYSSLDDLGTLKIFSWKAAKDTIDNEYADAAWWATPTIVYGYATLELIASQELKSLKFLPLFLTK
jgi:hypothetical protein